MYLREGCHKEARLPTDTAGTSGKSASHHAQGLTILCGVRAMNGSRSGISVVVFRSHRPCSEQSAWPFHFIVLP